MALETLRSGKEKRRFGTPGEGRAQPQAVSWPPPNPQKKAAQTDFPTPDPAMEAACVGSSPTNPATNPHCHVEQESL